MKDGPQAGAGHPFPSSLCHQCRSVRYVESARGSVFVRCLALAVKYPPQPVRVCAAFVARPADLEAPTTETDEA